MRFFLTKIVFVLILVTMDKSYGQSKSTEDLIQCFDLLFNGQKFDSVYFSHRHINSKKCFFVLRNDTSEKLINLFSEDKDLFELPNGYVLSVDAQGRLFVFGIKYYFKFKCIEISDFKIKLILGLVEYNGVREKNLGLRTVIFEKRGSWEIIRDTMDSEP